MAAPKKQKLKAKHPLQPLVVDAKGVTRFKSNKIVSYLLDLATNARIADMNMLAILAFPQEDREQFAQLIGYSLDGFGDLSYVRDRTYSAAASQKVYPKQKEEPQRPMGQYGNEPH